MKTREQLLAKTVALRYKKQPNFPRILNAKEILIRLNFEKNEKRKGILELYKKLDRTMTNIIFLTVGHLNINETNLKNLQANENAYNILRRQAATVIQNNLNDADPQNLL